MFCASGGGVLLLLTDYIEATGGSSELIIVLIKVGALRSSETLDRHIMKVSTQQLMVLLFNKFILRSRALHAHEAGISVYFWM